MEEGIVQFVPRLPCSFESPARSGGPHLMIRTGQIAAFQEFQMEVFTEELANRVVDQSYGRVPLTEWQIREDVRDRVSRGRQFGLVSREDLVNFVFCSLRFGSELIEPHVAALGSSDAMSPQLRWDLSLQLHQWARYVSRESA